MTYKLLDSSSKPVVPLSKVLEYLGAEVVHRMLLQEELERLQEQAQKQAEKDSDEVSG